MSKKILIIDDHAEIREMYENALNAQDYDVRTRENGLTGVMCAVDFNPDLILLDIMMPQMDGFAVLEALNQNEKVTKNIIIISNLDGENDKKRALNLGAAKYIVKSEYTPDQIVDEIEKKLAT